MAWCHFFLDFNRQQINIELFRFFAVLLQTGPLFLSKRGKYEIL